MQTQDIAQQILQYCAPLHIFQFGRICKSWHCASEVAIQQHVSSYVNKHCQQKEYFTLQASKITYNYENVQSCCVNTLLQLITRAIKLDASKTSTSIVELEIMIAKTYSNFCTTRELLNKTLGIFFANVPQDAVEQHTTYQSHLLRFWKLLVRWNFAEIKFEEGVLGLFMCFVSHVVKTQKGTNYVIAKQIQMDIREHCCTKVAPLFPATTTTTMTIMDFSDTEIAEQLTLYMKYYFNQIALAELHSMRWAKASSKARCPNVLQLIQISNRLPTYMQLVILGEPDLKKRARLIDRWICILKKCFELHNMIGAHFIRHGLQAAAIFRLKDTWAKAKETKGAFTLLVNMFSGERGYKDLRTVIKDMPSHGLPSIALAMTDLTFIYDGNTDFVFERIWNISKARLTCQVFDHLLQFKVPAQGIAANPELLFLLHNLLQNEANISDDALYKKSLEIQKRI